MVRVQNKPLFGFIFSVICINDLVCGEFEVGGIYSTFGPCPAVIPLDCFTQGLGLTMVGPVYRAEIF